MSENDFDYELNIDDRGLPSWCFVCLESTGEVVVVRRDQKGYWPTRQENQPWYGQETADIANTERGISKAQAEAMKMGSMFGFHGPLIIPDNYDDNGSLKKK